MPTLYFSNNGEALLTAPLESYNEATADYGVMHTDAPDTMFSGRVFSGPIVPPYDADSVNTTSGELLTLSNLTMPGIYEVVLVTNREYGNGVMHVVRGIELVGASQAPAWPLGSKVSANVTARMLSAFPQGNAESFARIDFDSGYLHGRDYTNLAFAQAPALPAVASVGRQFAIGAGASIVDATEYVDLGAPPTFTKPSNLHHGWSYLPPTADGHVYSVYSKGGFAISVGPTSAVVFPGSPGPFSILDENDSTLGHMFGVEYPVNTRKAYGSATCLVEEVGFIASEVTAAATPTVSIGHIDDGYIDHPTTFANAVPLTQIGVGGMQIHRIPIAAPILTRGVVFRVDTPAPSGAFRGRFYWRGLIIG